MEPYLQFERQFAEFAITDNMVACSSGTAALHLALESFQFPLGSEVILCDYNMIACARAATLAGLKPVFVDCRDDLLIDPALVHKAITPKTVAVMAVHIYGRRCDMIELTNICREHNLKLVEDLAEAHNVMPHIYSDVACWSFYKNKIIAGEEGGALSFVNPNLKGREVLVKRAKQLRSLGFTEVHDFYHIPRGHNYRMSNAHAKLILESLENFTANMRERLNIESMYKLSVPKEWQNPFPRMAPWVFDLRIEGMSYRQQAHMVESLNAAMIQARHGFKPMSAQMEYRWNLSPQFSFAYQATREVIYLPILPGITNQLRVDRSIEVIKECIESWKT